MERAKPLAPPVRLTRASVPDLPAAAAWLLAAVVIVYLSLEGGGYDVIPRNEVGIAIWWVLLLGAALGALPAPGATRTGLAALLALTAFVAWTALSITWTESAERTTIELSRVATYLGVFALALSALRRVGGRPLLGGATFGIALVTGLAVLSRLHPAWFPENDLGTFLQGIEIERRLAYPLNYSSGLAAFAGIALPLLLAATAATRTIAGQALAAAALPVAGLALYLATSGAGAATGVVALIVFIALAPDRLPKLATLAVGAAGTAILSAAVDQRAALDRGLPTAAAQQQGDEVLAMALVVCAGVALIQVGVSLAVRYGSRPRLLTVPPRRAWVATVAALAIAIPAVLAAGLPGEISDRWETFKGRGEPTSSPSSSSTILDTGSSGRYQFWESAVDAGETEPLLGIGPGTFEFWWAREGSYAGFVRDAHSLYLETFAELGIVGLLLIGGFVLGVVGIGATRALRGPPEARLSLAAATGGCAGFATAAALDWAWELAVLPIVFMVLAALAVEGGATETAPHRTRPKNRLAPRIVLAALSIAALVAIYFPLSSASAVRDSQLDAGAGELDASLEEARDAVSAQPYAATPRLQEALVLELEGRIDEAASAAREATRKESTNWRPWLILSRLEAERGNATQAVAAYERARSLNPRSGAVTG